MSYSTFTNMPIQMLQKSTRLHCQTRHLQHGFKRIRPTSSLHRENEQIQIHLHRLSPVKRRSALSQPRLRFNIPCCFSSRLSHGTRSSLNTLINSSPLFLTTIGRRMDILMDR
ncbi:hypothetical protein BLNAU_7323 [Blattamonas nauphoetae]|uniref:Uncharacterized protein n=1 Tax=Blattamonas nauphoetae TaxID=2049346 RepID=A0ABQ9Y1U5_9EUKA|nr:hypothetical protein BLNAU_7323 [Blattamonas nauphoetae]